MLEEIAQRKKSRIILALDLFDQPKTLENARKVLESVKNHVIAVKLNRPVTDELGIHVVKKLKRFFDGPFIADFKIADIGRTAIEIVKMCASSGYWGVITTGIMGERALKEMKAHAEEQGIELILVPILTSSTRERLINWRKIVKIGLKVGIEYFVGPSTDISLLRRMKRIIGKRKLMAVGIGAQGGKIEQARNAGASFFIVGRAIYNSKSPEKVAREMAKKSFKKGFEEIKC